MNADELQQPSFGSAEALVTSHVPGGISVGAEGHRLAAPGVPIGARRDDPEAGQGAEGPENQARAMENVRVQVRRLSGLQAIAGAGQEVQGGFVHERIASMDFRHQER